MELHVFRLISKSLSVVVHILICTNWFVYGKHLNFQNVSNDNIIIYFNDISSYNWTSFLRQETKRFDSQKFAPKIETKINIYDTGVSIEEECKTFQSKSRRGVVDFPMQFILMGAVSDYLNFSCQFRSTLDLKQAAHMKRERIYNSLEAPYIIMSLTLPGAELPEGAKFTSYFAESLFSFATGLPRRKLRLLTSLRPFEPLVWLIILVSFLPAAVTSIGIIQTRRAIRRDLVLFNRVNEVQSWMSFSSISYSLFRSLVAQDNYNQKIVSLTALRFIVASWQFFALLICTGYTSRLFNIIQNPRLSKVPTTWETLANSSYGLGTPNFHQTRTILQGDVNTSASSPFFAKYRGMSRPLRLKSYSIEDCMGNATVLKDFACLVTDNRLTVNAFQDYVTTAGTTLVQASPFEKISKDRHFPVFRLWVYKFTDLKRKININGGVNRFFETGFTQKWEKDYSQYVFRQGLRNAKNVNDTSPILSAIERSNDRLNGSIRLRHYDITGILIILAIGLIMSSLVFLKEICYTCDRKIFIANPRKHMNTNPSLYEMEIQIQ